MFDSLLEELAFYKTAFAIAGLIALTLGVIVVLVLRRHVIDQALAGARIDKLNAELDSCSTDNIRLRRIINADKPYPFDILDNLIRKEKDR